MAREKQNFGTESLGLLLRKQAIPASVGILVMSVYGIVDTLFVGRFVGSLAIGAITVNLPITFLISSIGMAIGIGGGSVLSRAMGENNHAKVQRTFGNQIALTLSLSILIVLTAYFLQIPLLRLFGGKGAVLEPALAYFQILLPAIPALAWSMMANNVIRAEGYPRIAMFTMIIPALSNIILDPIFIVGMDMGIEGAALATSISYVVGAIFTLIYFLFGPSEMSLSWNCIKPSWSLIKEIGKLGSVTLARQGTISLLSVVLNNSLFAFGGEMALASYGIVSRLLMFVNFPVLGITQGYVPILGYNYGARLYERVTQISRLAFFWSTGISVLIFILIMTLTEPLVQVFTADKVLIAMTVPALRWVFAANPFLPTSFLGSAYFQAIGQARRALILALSKQGFFLIPLILILPHWLGVDGIWWSFPIADMGSAALAWWLLSKNPYIR
ncbi:MATE family efflux transporter [Croceimicrobium sp.]|uniref:MATE family efflux transporter n=1 Tax=Croceimicrobium sp. TaxID=2828340 RepID=UPI003BACF9EF